MENAKSAQKMEKKVREKKRAREKKKTKNHYSLKTNLPPFPKKKRAEQPSQTNPPRECLVNNY